MKNNYIETLDLPNQYSVNKILSISFIWFDVVQNVEKLHQIKWKNDKFDWCSVKTFVSEKEQQIFDRNGIFKDEKELLELRNLILSKI
jgi:hypothetical protein